MEMIRRGRALIKSRTQQPNLDMVTTFNDVSPERCFEIIRRTPEEDQVPDENTEVASQGTTTYAGLYINLIKSVGIIPYNFGKSKQSWSVEVLRKISFAVFAIFCIFQGFERTKYFIFRFARKKDLESYIEAGYYTIHGIARLYFVKFLLFNHNQMTAFVDSLETKANCGSGSQSDKPKIIGLLTGLTLLSLAFALLLTMFDWYGWTTWNLQDFLMLRSFQITNSVLAWSVENSRNVSETIEMRYGTNMTSTTVAFGITCTVMNFSGNLQDFVIQDLTLCVSLTLYVKTQYILGTLRASDQARSTNGEDLGENWKRCVALKALSDSANETFGVSLKLMHIKHLFTITFVLLGWLVNDELDVFDAVLALNMGKIIFFYWIALKTAEQGNACRRWIKKKSRIHETALVDNEVVKTAILLDDYEDDPIGIGTNKFLINEGFMIMMFGTIASVFMIFAQQREGQASCKCNCNCNQAAS